MCEQSVVMRNVGVGVGCGVWVVCGCGMWCRQNECVSVKCDVCGIV